MDYGPAQLSAEVRGLKGDEALRAAKAACDAALLRFGWPSDGAAPEPVRLDYTELLAALEDL